MQQLLLTLGTTLNLFQGQCLNMSHILNNVLYQGDSLSLCSSYGVAESLRSGITNCLCLVMFVA